jgi:hypothetical protein
MKVFISSTRVDADWTQQLCAFLADRGFKPIIDGRDISSADAWKQRIQALLSGVDAVVFVLTEASAEAIECEWEVAEAQRLGKRVVAVLPEPLHGRAPDFLADRNYVLFYTDPVARGSGFYAGQKQLEAALRQKPAAVRLARPASPPTPPPRAPVMAPNDPDYWPSSYRQRVRVPWLRMGILAGAAGFVYVGVMNPQAVREFSARWSEVLTTSADAERPTDGRNVSAQDYTPERPLFAGANGANVRNYPLPSATILQELPAATALNINGRLQVQGDWWFRVVLADERVGFVHESATARQAAAPATVALTPIDPPVSAQAGRAGANIRSAPGLRARRLVRIEAGAAVTVTGSTRTGGHLWYQVQLASGQSGFAREDVLATREGRPFSI